MSSMLEQAIIDATALRETAIKSAEQAVVDRYSGQIKDAVDGLLESDILNEAEIDAEGEETYGKEENAPKDVDPSSTLEEQLDEADKDGGAYAFLEGTELSELDEDEEIEINIEKLVAEALAIEEESEIDESLLSDDLLLGVDEDGKKKKKKKVKEDDDAEQELSDDDIKVKNIAKVVVVKDDDEFSDDDEVEMAEGSKESLELDETIVFDYDSVPQGETSAYGTPTKRARENKLVVDVLNQIEKYNDDLANENKKLKKENKQLKNALGTSNKKNEKLLESVSKIKNKFDEVSLMNAKLLYTNKVYVDGSLNERQKKNIVESINKAQTVEQTKIVYETLQGAVGKTIKRVSPESLSEAVGNRTSSSLTIKARRENTQKTDSNPFAARMKILAGI
jgi:hypothetical protein